MNPFRILINTLIILYLTGFPFQDCLYAEPHWVSVSKIWDGDTVVLVDNRTVRYIGIDTPELNIGDQAEEPFSRAAKRFNSDLVLRKRIRMEFDRVEKDRYGRWLGYLFLEDGLFVNEALVRKGLAFVLPSGLNDKYRQQLLLAQNRAMDDHTGIWSLLVEKDGKYIGNRHSGRFHQPDCPSARKISASRWICFSSKEQAFRKGYAPCRRCGIKVWK